VETFQKIKNNVYLLKVPFGPVWTGVVLLRGEENILIDTSATGHDVDHFLIPALKELGLAPKDIAYLVNTHSHGDHIGGNFRLRQLGDFKVAAYEAMAPKVSDPVPYAIQTRTRFPEYSPAPQSQLQGIPVDIVLQDGEILANRLQVIHTPGHDNDCVCWYDLETKTIITGDSLQANGTICQGVGFYKSLPDYLRTLERLNKMDIENILCGHDYEGIGYWIEGKERVKEALAYCRDRVDAYHRFILARKDRESAQIATELINELGCGMPERLFMALYTVTEHLNYKGE
jgi:glyoxylase-like metal-dependent hydrolase (beta-lactamase superfamily II)